MLLSQLVHKEVFVKGVFKGICLGVGVSKKNYAVKYVLCSSVATPVNARRVDFAVNFSSVNEVFSGGLHLSSLRPVYPKNVFFLFPDLPVYTGEGVGVGAVMDAVIENGVLKTVRTAGKQYAFSCVSACADAVILKTPKPYPLGITLPSGNGCVTKPILKNAVKSGNLIKFTLSLAPFDLTAN